ncbi:MAG TPA: 6,7-dimethyl-8-ribityllumazine synthase [Thermoanaerobaculia bacterium]|nr:6,7-dimethyl-8-ribityllumazine synthase [Thermoanaerobaculia bacterium]
MTFSTPQLRGSHEGGGRRFAIVAASFNQRIVSQLLAAASDCLAGHGVAPDDIQVVSVPGAWEIPQALEELAVGGKFDALIALGAVIRGDTPHFEYICAECSGGVARVSSKHRIPVAFGVLTCDTTQQAEERAGGRGGNKGTEAALAALEMASLFGKLRG